MEWKKFLQEKNCIMTFCVENETNKELPFDVEDIVNKVIERALKQMLQYCLRRRKESMQ